MLRLFIIIQISILFLALCPAKSYAQTGELFESLKGTEENPLLDIKYNVEIEPFNFDPTGHDDIAFHTYLRYNATYADGSNKTDRFSYPNFRFGFPSCSFEPYLSSNIEILSKSEIRDFSEEEKSVKWEIQQTLLQKEYNFWNYDEFLQLRNLDQTKRTVIMPYNAKTAYALDDVSYTETERAFYEDDNFKVYSNYCGYNIISGTKHFAWGEFGIFNPVICAKDGNNTIIRLSPVKPGQYLIELKNHGNEYGYMETIGVHCIMELFIEDSSFKLDYNYLVHFDYPKSEQQKQAAREAGYDVP